MSIRLSKACKDLNVAMASTVEFLAKNNIYISLDPNLKLADEIYLLLANEFNKDLAIKIDSDRLNLERVCMNKNQPFNSITSTLKNQIMDTTVNNILEALKANAALKEFKQNKMENKTPFDIIQSTENAPFTLNKLTEDFLALETHFNNIVENLNIEKDSIENNTSSSLSFIKNQHKQQVKGGI